MSHAGVPSVMATLVGVGTTRTCGWAGGGDGGRCLAGCSGLPATGRGRGAVGRLPAGESDSLAHHPCPRGIFLNPLPSFVRRNNGNSLTGRWAPQRTVLDVHAAEH